MRPWSVVTFVSPVTNRHWARTSSHTRHERSHFSNVCSTVSAWPFPQGHSSLWQMCRLLGPKGNALCRTLNAVSRISGGTVRCWTHVTARAMARGRAPSGTSSKTDVGVAPRHPTAGRRCAAF